MRPNCAGCGETVELTDGFCGHCGLPNTAGNRDGDDGAAGNGTESSPRPWAVIVTAAVLALSALGYLAMGPGLTGERRPDDTGTAVADLAEPQADRQDSLDWAPPELAPHQEEPVGVGPDVNVREIERADLATLEELTLLRGLYIFVGDGHSLLRIDTDTGNTIELDTRFMLADHYRDRLILVDPVEGIVTVSVEDPGQVPHQLVAFDAHPSNAGPDAGVEIRDLSVSSGRWLDFSYYQASGRTYREEAVVIDLVDKTIVADDDETYSWWGRSGDVRWVPGGGTFQRTDDGYEHLSDGQAQLVGSRSILVSLCEAPDDCRQQWLDRTTGEPSGRPLAHAGAAYGHTLSGSDRVARVWTDVGNEIYYDLELGKALPGNVPGSRREIHYEHLDGDDVTDDDRFLFTIGDKNELLIYDLDTQKAFAVGGALPSGSPNIVAVPKPDPALGRDG